MPTTTGPMQMTKSAIWEQAASTSGGIHLEDDGDSIILDRYGHRAVRTGDATFTEVDQAIQYLQQGPFPQSRTVFELNVCIEAFDREDDRQAAECLIRSLIATGKVVLRIHFARPPVDYSPLLVWLGGLRRQHPKPRDLLILLFGRAPMISDDTKEFLLKNSILVEAVHGWWPDASSEDCAAVDDEALRDLTEFGLVVPVLWYVHQANIHEMPRLIESSLQSNYNSGFSTLPQAHSPYAAVGGPPKPALPEQFSELLVALYECHIHNDERFSPLNEIATRCNHPAWNHHKRVPNHFRLLMSGDGSVRCFRQLPLYSLVWLACDEVKSMDAADILTRLSNFHERHYSLDNNSFCRSCAWRFMCGGLDGSQAGDEQADSYVLTCYYRKLFLEAFVRQRVKTQAMPVLPIGSFMPA